MSAGPAWPPVWNAARPTPAGEVMAQATACSNGVTPRAAMIPPTSSAPVSARISTASCRYPGERSACPSTRATIGNRDALMAALLPAGIRPFGLSTTVIRGSAAARSRAIRAVLSLDGPTASTTSMPRRVVLGEHMPDRLCQVALLVAHRHDHRDRCGGGKGDLCQIVTC